MNDCTKRVENDLLKQLGSQTTDPEAKTKEEIRAEQEAKLAQGFCDSSYWGIETCAQFEYEISTSEAENAARKKEEAIRIAMENFQNNGICDSLILGFDFCSNAQFESDAHRVEPEAESMGGTLSDPQTIEPTSLIVGILWVVICRLLRTRNSLRFRILSGETISPDFGRGFFLCIDSWIPLTLFLINDEEKVIEIHRHVYSTLSLQRPSLLSKSGLPLSEVKTVFETLILKWGYLVLGIGTFLEGENILITAGVMAHKGLLSLPLVILVATIGAFLGDICWYFVGRRFGNPYIQKRPKLIQRVEGVRRLLDKYGTLFVLSFRFIYGLRSVSPLILGALHYPVPKFIALNAVAAVVWGVSFSYLGFTLGAGFLELAGRHPLLEEAVLIAAGSVFILWLLFRIAKRRNH